MLVLFSLSVALSAIATWARDQIDDRDRYVDTVGPLATNEAIQDEVAAQLSNILTTHIDEATTRASLSENQQFLAAAPTSALRLYVEETIRAIVRSDRFARFWLEAHRAAHPIASGILTGRGTDGITATGSRITIDLAPLVAEITARLQAEGIRIPAGSSDRLTIAWVTIVVLLAAIGLIAVWTLPRVARRYPLDFIPRRRERDLIRINEVRHPSGFDQGITATSNSPFGQFEGLSEDDLRLLRRLARLLREAS